MGESIMSLRILITGGSGFIGRNVSRCLRECGHQIFSPTHQELDITNVLECTKYVWDNKIEAIVHTAFKCKDESKNKHQDFVDNIEMFETLTWLSMPTIIIGSGAEFDRRVAIDHAKESDLFDSWPIDLYGLSKNIISRRTLGGELRNAFILRLFGCFGSDEENFRFIKRSILRLKQGLPIEINKDKEMDFFFVDDVAKVIDCVLLNQKNGPRHVNLVYHGNIKHTLKDVGEMICKEMNIPVNIQVQSEIDSSYTGDGSILQNENIKLIGLESGLKQMVKELA